jgi:hypothetical protein
MAQKGASAAVLFWPRLQPRPKTLSQRRHPSGILGTTLAWPAKQRKHRHHPALIRSESAARHRLIRTSEHYIDHHLLITFSVDRVMGQHSESSEAGRSGGQAEWGRAASQMGGADNTIILIRQLLALEPAEGVPPPDMSVSSSMQAAALQPAKPAWLPYLGALGSSPGAPATGGGLASARHSLAVWDAQGRGIPPAPCM